MARRLFRANPWWLRRGAIDAASHKPDLVIMDLGWPDFDGVDVIRQIRQWLAMPVLVLSARARRSARRSKPSTPGSPELLDLELFLGWRAQGLPLETPGVRR